MIFPCDFSIKIIGENKASLIQDVLALAKKQFPDTSTEAIRSRASQQDNYLALTLTVHAEDQPTLDALYRELTRHPDIKMVL